MKNAADVMKDSKPLVEVTKIPPEMMQLLQASMEAQAAANARYEATVVAVAHLLGVKLKRRLDGTPETVIDMRAGEFRRQLFGKPVLAAAPPRRVRRAAARSTKAKKKR